MPLLPKDFKKGTKQVFFHNKIIIDEADGNLLTIGEEFTLFNWGNAIVKSKDEVAKTMEIDLHLEGDFKSTKNKITWISKIKNNTLLKITLTKIGNLITVPSLPKNKKGDNKEDIDWKIYINPNLKSYTKCYGEDALTNVKKGDILQIMRKGNFIVHKVDNDEIELVEIP